jgi:subtilisin family serine protease
LLFFAFFYTACQEETKISTTTHEVLVEEEEEEVPDTRVRPVPKDYNYTIFSNQTLVNHIGYEGEPSGYIVYDIVQSVKGGTIELNRFDGKYIYTPSRSYEGNDSFTYHLIGADDENKVATVKIQVFEYVEPQDTGSGGTGGGGSVFDYSGLDADNDYIADELEAVLGMDSTDDDQNNNGITDGFDTQGSFGDTFFDKQWHIRSLGTSVNDSGVQTIVGNDMNITRVYSGFLGYNGGENIIVSVVDDGVDADHEDLVSNMDLTRSRDAVDGQNGDPSPHSDDDTHGTMCAGIIGARAFNAKGVRGIAPFVKIAGNNWLEIQTIEELELAWYSGEGAEDIAVSSNSWGSSIGISKSTYEENILRQGASSLRGGKGRIYVKAAGNGRDSYECANLEYGSNNEYIITVAALSHQNRYSSYSSSGANILVSAYAGHYYQNSPTIGTTINMGKGSGITWDEDTAGNYTYAMNGTSAATPGVAAAVALVLEACPDLTYRDIKYLIAHTSTQIDTSNASWEQNSAGLWHSTDYGYGLVNTIKMIDTCTRSDFSGLPSSVGVSVSKSVSTSIPDGDYNGVDIGIDVGDDIKIEHIGVILDIEHDAPNELEINLISPAGTQSQLLFANNNLEYYPEYFVDGGRLGASGFMDENSSGTWQVNINDQVSGNEGRLISIQMNFTGYTDE